MDKYTFDESNGLWGQRHLWYLKEHHKDFYTSLQLSGKLNSYLANLNQQAQNLMDTFIR